MNIDDRKKTEEALKESEEKYRALYENVPLAYQSLNIDGVLIDVNPQWLAILGYEKDEVIGKWFGNFLHPEFQDHFRKNFPVFKKQGYIKNVQFKMVRKDGTIIFVAFEGCIGYNPDKTFKQTYCTFKDITKEKAAEEALQKEKERYKEAEQIAHLGSWEMDIATGKAIWSDEFFRICGFEPQSFAPTNEKRVNSIHPEDRERAGKAVEDAITTGNPYNIEKRIIRPSGEVRWVRSQGKIIYDANKKPKKLTGSFLDITENMLAKEKLEQSEKIKSLVLESTQELFAYYDTNLKTLWANNAAAESVGLSPEEMKTKHCYELWQKRDTPCEDCPLVKVRETKKPHETEIKSPDNRYWQIRGYPVLDKNGELTGLIEFGQDISKRKKYETELKKAKELAELNESKYKTIFEGAPIGIFRSTLEGKFIEVNPALANMLGYNKPQEVLDDIDDIARQIYVEGSKRDSIVDNSAKTKIDKYDNVYRRKNGEVFNANLFLRKITDENGQEILEGIVEETTERKKYEEKLKNALQKAEESNQLKTEFLNNMSHEVRTPMNGIMGFAQMLNRPNMKPEKKTYYTQIIQQNSNQLLKIIDDILEISRLETKQVKVYPETFCLNRVIEMLYTTYKKQMQPGVTLKIKKGIPDAESAITTDKSKLIKILTSLIDNAIKFTTEGYIEIGYQLKQNKIELYVKDTGIGIEAQNKKLIFERFSHENITIASEKGGLGIGLPIAKENTELIGGKITLESQKGKGSTFFVTLPFTPIENNDQTDCRNHDQTHTKKLKMNHTHTILIAEDDEINFLYMEALLNEEIEGNFNIIHVKNGKSAIAACKENSNIELVLMDIKMPDMNGYEATKTIKSFRPTLPVIAQTAFSTVYEKSTANNAGCDEFISKPIVRENLTLLLQRFLKQE